MTSLTSFIWDFFAAAAFHPARRFCGSGRARMTLSSAVVLRVGSLISRGCSRAGTGRILLSFLATMPVTRFIVALFVSTAFFLATMLNDIGCSCCSPAILCTNVYWEPPKIPILFLGRHAERNGESSVLF